MDPDAVRAARASLDAATRVVVLTGAGISTAVGIPDFRGPDGVWTKDPAAERRATIEYYVDHPEARREAWRTRAARANVAPTPSRAHRALAEFEARGTLTLLVTQNIDGLHLAAGSDPALVVEIHGSARDSVCLRCGHREPIELTFPRVLAGDDDPRCRQIVDGTVCGGILKSAVISFGQPIDPVLWARCEAAVAHCDLLVCVGSTLTVYPAASLVPRARAAGATVVIVNGEATALDHDADVVVRGDIEVVVPALVGAPERTDATTEWST